jgi:flagellar basal body rod protein FlgB
MLFGIFSRTGQSDALRAQLDASAQRTRDIAGRVARASMTADGRGGFSIDGPDAQAVADGATDGVNVESEMASLADEQLRYDATAKLLEQTYQQFRSTIADH